MFLCDFDWMGNGYLQPFDGVNLCGSKKGEAGQQPPCHPHDHHLNLKDTPEVPNWTALGLAHFTLGRSQVTAPPSPRSLSDWRQRLWRVGCRLPPPPNGANRSQPRSSRAFSTTHLGPSAARFYYMHIRHIGGKILNWSNSTWNHIEDFNSPSILAKLRRGQR